MAKPTVCRSIIFNHVSARFPLRALALFLLVAASPCHALDAVAVKRQVDGIVFYKAGAVTSNSDAL
ncbi:hypothetical protein [Xanthomonas oryzae]|uniref:hypothetical protein n=1 Tax=Xanthomonas oryzae TaxID=347 RepID=UPI00040EBF96|nr:hypothetical protein [Xanthomonas oryzae]UWI56993.1 hypothetical protein NO430_00485 [Xanthomonas oryzae pv. oryzae]